MLAKFTGHAGGLAVAAVVIPWLAVWLLLTAAEGAAWPAARWAGTVALMTLFVLFHVALVLALNATTWSRGAALGVPLALLVGSDLVTASLPWVAGVNPYLLGRLAGGLLSTGELMAVGPPIAAAAATVVLLAVAIWRFTRQEL